MIVKICPIGPALVFEGEESMITAISEDPMSFKVRDSCIFVRLDGTIQFIVTLQKVL